LSGYFRDHHQGGFLARPELQWRRRGSNGEKTLHSAAVAVVRSGNERAFKLVKMSWAIKKGASLTSTRDLVTLDNIWMGWGFRINSFIVQFIKPSYPYYNRI
jgi:hypothetical protein